MTEIEKLEQALEFMNTHRLCGLCTTPKTKNLESCTKCECYIARSTILISLREKLDRLKNPPMTLEELRCFVEKDIAIGYVKELDTGFVFGCVFDNIRNYGVVGVWYASNDETDWYKECDYGKTWIAYRYRPEDGEE